MTALTGKTALITGASAGLGWEFAKLFAADGHSVVLVARRLARLEELAAKLAGEHGVKAIALEADLVAPGAPVAIRDALADQSIDIEFLVNNAGFGSTGPFVDQPIQRELDMIAVNISALTHLSHLFLPGMLQRGSGRILNMGSTAGFQPGPFMATYYASKAYVNHFSEALAGELRGTGVTVTVSCPGPVATEFGSVAGNDKSRLFKRHTVATSESVAASAYRAMMKGRRMVVHGVSHKVAVQMLRLAPRSMVQNVTRKLNSP